MRVLLERERCASSLAARLGVAGPPAIHQAALQDTQATLARQAPLGELARLGRERGFPVVALKSAAHATQVPSLDLDVLVPEARLTETIQYLAAKGYKGLRGRVAAREIQPMHVPALGRPGEMMVEVHFSLGDGLPVDEAVWQALRPHPVHAGICRLSPERHAWHLSWHSAVFHPDRRGQLGDLLLIAEALSDLDSVGRSWLDAQVAAHPGSGPLQRALRMADALRSGDTPSDEFRAVAAAQYRLRLTPAVHHLPARMAKQLEAQWFELVEGGSLAGLWRKLVLGEETLSARPWLYALERAAPWLTRAGRVAARAAVFTVTVPFARRLSRASLEDARGSTSDAQRPMADR
jgi:hypothetical protein